jgi:serine/threonine protein kinase/class 3 adenylate cyclase
MFTDLVDSTARKRQIGVDAFAPLLARHDALFRRAVSDTSTGRVLQDTGDGYFAGFDAVSDAVRTALRFQWLMHAEPWPHPMAARVGIHMGQVAELAGPEQGEGKLVATAIDLASRVMSLAQGGQILLTRVVFDEAREFVKAHPAVSGENPAPPLRWIAHGPYLFKGNDEPMDVFEVGAEGFAPLAPPPDSEKAKRHIRPGDDQTLGWRPAVGLPMPGAPSWVISRKLGQGGFGEVWLATHAKGAGDRVFKFCFDPERLRALKREVALFRLLKEALGDRRDIARLIDWQLEHAPYYVETEYAPAGNLLQWSEARGGIGEVPPDQRLEIVAGVAEALAAAHSVGVLHKDIKPSNILMSQSSGGEPQAKLADFGIGMLAEPGRLGQYNITEAGFTASNISIAESSRTGTRMYAPPESLTDVPFTIQGDVYALGVLLYQMVVGDLNRPLGVGWEREVGDDLLREDIRQCVDADRERRFRSAAELAQRLRTLAERRRVRLGELSAARRRQRVRLLGTVGLLVAVVSILAGTSFWKWREARGQAAAIDQARVRRLGLDYAVAVPRSASAFDTVNHPSFGRQLHGVDGTPLRFNHAKHLNELPNPPRCTDCHNFGEVTPAVTRLDADAPISPVPAGDGERTIFAPLPARLALGPTTLPTKLDYSTDHRYMQPVRYDEHCASCHPIQITPGDAPLPHLPIEQLRSWLDTPTRLRRTLVSMTPAERERALTVTVETRQGIRVVRETKKLTEEEWVAQKVKDFNSHIESLVPKASDDLSRLEEYVVRRHCRECHEMSPTANQPFQTLPTGIGGRPRRWYPSAEFSHESHAASKCVDCHQTAVQSRLTSDLLLPDIQRCVKCHNPKGETGSVAPTACVTCHRLQ